MKYLILLLMLAGLSMAAKKTVSTAYDWILQRMAEAIQEFEGWYEGSRSYRNNNPGNLKYIGQAGASGADETGHAIFVSFQAGWDALINQLRLAFENRSHVYSTADSLYDFFAKYAEGNSRQYAEYVAGKLGVNPDSTLGDLIS